MLGSCDSFLKKYFIFIVSLVFVLSFSIFAQADFVVSGNTTLYQDEDGKYLTGLQKIDGEYYYFDSSGVLQKACWIKTPDQKEYYATANGTLACNQWMQVGKKTFYLKNNAEKAKGITRIGSQLFYFSIMNGKLLKGKLKDAYGNLYITNKKGVVFSGRLFKQSGAKYYANYDGTLAKGLKQLGSDYYFFKKTNGKMVTNKKKAVGNDFYFFTKAGPAVKNRWVKIKGNYYYFNADGRMARNQYIQDQWYVGEDGIRVRATGVSKTDTTSTEGTADASGMSLTNDTSTSTVEVLTGSTGVSLVEYAKKFLGLPYVWGGTSLKTGADCSGFCQAIHLAFGITIMRVADDQKKGPSESYQKLGYKKGIQIADNMLSSGDLVFYDSDNNGVADHVAMYIGNNKVIHEAGKKYGCIISDIDWAHGRCKNKNMRYWA